MEFALLCHKYLLMRHCHMLQFTTAYFSLTSQIWQRNTARENAPLHKGLILAHMNRMLIYEVKYMKGPGVRRPSFILLSGK